MAAQHITDADFQKMVLESDKPVLVDFYAVWCGPCKMAAPVLDKMSDELKDRLVIVKMDVDENTATPGTYGVMSIPTVILFNKGKEVERKVGFGGEKGYRDLIAKSIIGLSMYNAQTTDNQGEVFDLVDENDQVIGTATRREVHTNKTLIHRGVGIYVFNTKRQLLMQKRSKTKDTFPGHWAYSVGGHVSSGDTYEHAAKRELQEELGLDMSFEAWEKVLTKDELETEFWMKFVGIHNGPFPNFNTVEADEVRFFDVDELAKNIQNNTFLVTPTVKQDFPTVLEFVNSGRLDQLVQTYKETT